MTLPIDVEVARDGVDGVVIAGVVVVSETSVVAALPLPNFIQLDKPQLRCGCVAVDDVDDDREASTADMLALRLT